MNSQLDLLLSEGIISEVLGRLKSGKEAEVFRVVYRGNVVAAKVYKDRQQRSFQHNVAYKEGRKVRNSRTQRAIDKGSRFGRDEAEDAWKSSEASTLQLLHRQGVRVPTPVLFYEGVLLMELVNDADGDTAPRLIEAAIDAENAGPLYRDLRSQIIKVLCCDLIHGDLSPYNVLLGVAGPTIIDFPQAIAAAHNSQSEGFFQRDFENIHTFFAEHDRRLGAQRGDGREIWRAYTRRDLSPDFVPMTRPQAPPPRPQQPQGQGYGGQRGNDQRGGFSRYNAPRSGEPRVSEQRPAQEQQQSQPRFNEQRPAQEQQQSQPRFNEQRPVAQQQSQPRFNEPPPVQQQQSEPRVSEQRPVYQQPLNPPRASGQRPAQAPQNEQRPSQYRNGPRPPVADRFAEERPKDHRNDPAQSGGQSGGQRGGDQRGGGQRGGDQRSGGPRDGNPRSGGQRHPGPRQFDQQPSEPRPSAAQPPPATPAEGTRSSEWPSRPRVYEPPAGGARPPPVVREATATDPEARSPRRRSRRR